MGQKLTEITDKLVEFFESQPNLDGKSTNILERNV
jgi:hypothetical protein